MAAGSGVAVPPWPSTHPLGNPHPLVAVAAAVACVAAANAAVAAAAVALPPTVCCWHCCCGRIESVRQIGNNNAHVSKIEFKYTYEQGRLKEFG